MNNELLFRMQQSINHKLHNKGLQNKATRHYLGISKGVSGTSEEIEI